MYGGMCLMAFIGIISVIIFVTWLVYRAFRYRGDVELKPYKIMYGLAFISGILTFLYFFSTDISTGIKIITSIFLGLFLILIGSHVQSNKPHVQKKED